MELKDIFISEVSEKLKSRDKYRRLAVELDTGGYPNEAKILSGMADDEDRHANLLMTLSESLLPALEREELKLGERMIEVPIGAPYSYQITNWAVGEVYEPTAGYPSPHDALSAAKNFIEVELRVGHPAPEPRGYEVKVLSREGVVEPSYEEWYVPSWYGPPRPFPQTYGDWVDLAENIKERIPDDPATTATVNYQLNTIAIGESGVDEAKRWLTAKAGELGIK